MKRNATWLCEDELNNPCKPPVRKKWRDIVRTVLIEEGHTEHLHTWSNGICWTAIFSGPCFYVADMREYIGIFANFYPDEMATLHRFVEVLSKRDIAAVLIPETPQQGAHLRVMKPYDDRTETERECAATVDRLIKERYADEN